MADAIALKSVSSMRRIIVVLVAGLLAACQAKGTDFPDPAPADFVLGVTTTAEIIAKFGNPDSRTSRTTDTLTLAAGRPERDRPTTAEPGTLTGLRFVYVTKQMYGPIVSKDLTIDLWNDRLAGYFFRGLNRVVESDFNEMLAMNIDKGTATRESLEAVLGKPSGRAGYPLARRPGWETLIWQHETLDMRRLAKQKKVFRAELDPQGRLIDTQFESGEEILPQSQSTAPTMIFIPAVRGR